MDLLQVVAFALAQAKWLGLALLGTGIVIRLGGRALGHVLLAAGVLAAAAVAYQAWMTTHSLLVAGGIVVAGTIVFGLLAETVRGISFVFAFVVLAAAFYLLVYGWVGPTFASTSMGSLAWAGATILTMIVTGLPGALRLRAPAAAPAGGLLH